MRRSVEASGAGILTVSLRRESSRDAGAGSRFWDMVKGFGARILPNTAGCHTPREAITTAQMAREVFETNWVKLEVIANDDTLQPDVFGLVEAAEVLCRDGFQVFPYCTEDLSVAERLLRAGCQVLMPWAAPIGTGRGLMNPYAMRSLRAYFPNTPLIVDAGIGAPSHAAEAMEIGFDGILSTPRSPRRSTPWPWPQRSQKPSKLAASPIAPGSCRPATWPAPHAGRRPCLPRYRPCFLDFTPSCRSGLGRALGPRRRKTHPAADERRGTERNCPRDPRSAFGLPRLWLRARRQRLLAGGHRLRRSFVHLGQGDLQTADTAAIRRAG